MIKPVKVRYALVKVVRGRGPFAIPIGGKYVETDETYGEVPVVRASNQREDNVIGVFTIEPKLHWWSRSRYQLIRITGNFKYKSILFEKLEWVDEKNVER